MEKVRLVFRGVLSSVMLVLLLFAAPLVSGGQPGQVEKECRRCVREFCKSQVQACHRTDNPLSPECEAARRCVEQHCPVCGSV